MSRWLSALLLCLLSTAATAASQVPASPSPQAQRAAQPSVKRMLHHARQLVGTPYHWGGASRRTGFDCSGLLVYLFRKESGRELPRTTGEMISQQHRRVPREELKPGDAVFFSHNGSQRVSHVGLYLGQGRFIHAPSSGKRVRIDSLENAYWDRHYRTARRFRL